ncbi:MAG: M56 family metallopeptidase [Pirellula sp.]|nr:M56 family metallopeptidase [Pirellula sp.]
MISFPILLLLIQQSWQVALLAIAVWGITRYLGRDRAYLCHMLWAIVLIKCLTPPLWYSPVGIFSQIAHHAGLSLSPLEPSDFAHPSVSGRQMLSSHVTTHARMSNRGLSSDHSSGQGLLRNRGHQVCDALAGLWLTVAAGIAICSVIRYILFLRSVKQSTCDTPMAVTLCVKHLIGRLRPARNVHIRVVDNWVGPAVYGLWSPTIVLPHAIVVGRTQQELEPLIAHELVHIRRGDLWMALLQSIASALGWFHPLVWFASRQMTIESERCCDEATISLLQCKPSVYARSLLAVLEWKHRLRVAPALPGVRPVDVTSSRLERIMHLGQGSRSRSPWWVWCIALLFCGAVLPGAPFVGAQPPAQKESDLEVAKQPLASDARQDSPLPTAEKKVAATEANVVQVEIHTVEIRPESEEFKKLEQILNPQGHQVVSLLSTMPFADRLFYSGIQLPLSRSAAGHKIRRMHVGEIPIQQYQKIVSDELQGPGLTILSSPRLMIENGQTGQVTVGQMEAGNPEMLADGYSLSVRPIKVNADKIFVRYEVTRARTEKRPGSDEQKSPNLNSSNLPSPVRTTSVKSSVILDKDKAIFVVSPSKDTNRPLEITFVTCSAMIHKK